MPLPKDQGVKIRFDRVVALPIQIDDLLTSSRQNPPMHPAANLTVNDANAIQNDLSQPMAMA